MNVIISFETKPECSKEFHSIMLDTQKNLPKVEGCRAVSVYQEEDGTHRYTLIETWQSKESHQNHVSSMIQSGTWDDILKMLSQPPVSAYFTEL